MNSTFLFHKVEFVIIKVLYGGLNGNVEGQISLRTRNQSDYSTIDLIKFQFAIEKL
jgi:hypothetical protein